jgi:hypothetical protein
MNFINTTKVEEYLINDHLMSLITPTSRNDNNKTIIDKFWKNWYQIYKDYVYYIELTNEPSVTKCEITCSRFNIENNKYHGLTFCEYFNYIMNLDHYCIHPTNNTYIGQNNEIVNYKIQGNEKYEVFGIFKTYVKLFFNNIIVCSRFIKANNSDGPYRIPSAIFYS